MVIDTHKDSILYKGLEQYLELQSFFGVYLPDSVNYTYPF